MPHALSACNARACKFFFAQRSIIFSAVAIYSRIVPLSLIFGLCVQALRCDAQYTKMSVREVRTAAQQHPIARPTTPVKNEIKNLRTVSRQDTYYPRFG